MFTFTFTFILVNNEKYLTQAAEVANVQSNH